MTVNHSKFIVSKYLLLGIAFLCLTFLGCGPGPDGPNKTGTETVQQPDTGTDTEPGTETDTETDTTETDTETDTVSPEKLMVERVPKEREFKGMFVTTGRGSDAKWGVAKVMNFRYNVNVKATSQIVSREPLSSGLYKVEEIRTFDEVVDGLLVSDFDLQIRLDTLPVDTFFQFMDIVTTIYTFTTGDLPTGALVKAGEAYVKEKLKKIDGQSLRDMLKTAGLEIPSELDKYINMLINASMLQAMGGARDISGKKYKLTWYQDEAGQPFFFKYSYKNGSEVTNESEKLILKRINTFIDYYLAPNSNCKPGDSWTVSADKIQDAFDPFVDGVYIGSIGVKRNQNEGADWKLELLPSEIHVRSEVENETTGELKIEGGYAKLEPKSVTLKELFVEGTANLRKVSNHHILFTARIEGDCKFQGRLFSLEKSDGQESSDQK